jgi:ParB family chromosome partitioning protein
MAETVRLVDPQTIERNPENPRLIFHQDELDALQDSIKQQGILVPLTVYEDKKQLYILDGERRWRCALKLGLKTVPLIVQPKPTRMQNIMMMFAIHHRRNDWDPLPTAMKLQDLESVFAVQHGRLPSEAQLAELASLKRGEVRRLKKLLSLPNKYRTMLLVELNKPRSQQSITVDHVIEARNAATALRKRDIIETDSEEEALRAALIDKFRTKIIKSTVDPRKLARLARGVERKEVTLERAREVTHQLITDPTFSIDMAFKNSVEQVDFEHNIEQTVSRLSDRLTEHAARGYRPSPRLLSELRKLRDALARIVSG